MTAHLTTTLETSVTEDQIDHLGHMNVRFYGVNARTATRAFLEPFSEGVDYRPDDLYTRHLAEQLLGSPLAVSTGVLGTEPGAVRLYHELRNTETGALAASFVQRWVSDDASWPDERGEHVLGPRITEVPAEGRPRSIDLSLDPRRSTPSLDRARSLGLAMRRERTVDEEETVDGEVPVTNAPFLIWGGEPLEPGNGPMLLETPDGALVGWASLESRLTLGDRAPRLGDRIQSFGAVISLADKVSHRQMWAFDTETSEFLVGFEVVDIAFDTRGRRAVSIPPEWRAPLERKLHPDLGPR